MPKYASKITRNEQVVGSIPTGGSENPQLEAMIGGPGRGTATRRQGRRLPRRLCDRVLDHGIRTEEARALRWDHVSLDGNPGSGVPPHMAVWRSVRAGSDTKTERSRRTLASRRVLSRTCESSGRGKRRPSWPRVSYGKTTAWFSPAARASRWTTRTSAAASVPYVRRRVSGAAGRLGSCGTHSSASCPNPRSRWRRSPAWPGTPVPHDRGRLPA
jgi:hypothetical protein